jgi:superfamily I DNA and RNA helicase
MFDDEKNKNKENRRVIAKIRYKEWNERKAEEARHKKMVEKMEKQRIRMDEQESKRARLERIREMKKRHGYGG